MSDYTVTLSIPEDVYRRARQLAQMTAQPIEDVLTSYLADSISDLSALPPDEWSELAALNSLSDDTLRTIAAEWILSDD